MEYLSAQNVVNNMEKRFDYIDLAKALIKDARESNHSPHFDFSNMEILAKQLEDVFVIRWGKNQPNLKNVADYIKRLK